MRATLVLADFARVVDGKLDVLGAGWNMVNATEVTMGVGVIVEIPWSDTNRPHQLRLELFGADGEPVQLPSPTGEGTETLTVEAGFEVGRPPGIAPGTPLNMPFAVNVNNVPLPQGNRYEWRLTINGQSQADWYVGFESRVPAAFGPQ